MTDTKTCTKCGESKPATLEFFYSSGNRGCLKSRCKKCDNARRQEKAIDERKSGKFKERDAIYAKRYKEKRAQSWAVYYAANRDGLIKKSVSRFIEKYKTDEIFRVKAKMRTFVGESIRRKSLVKSESSEKILGISINDFILHIESNFLPGMTWENRSEWHIDHRVPLATAKTVEDVIRLNHYTNLRPLWAIDNLRKGAKLDYHL